MPQLGILGMGTIPQKTLLYIVLVVFGTMFPYLSFTTSSSRPRSPKPPARHSNVYQRRIVAVGDLHGDFAHATEVLRMAAIIDKRMDWIGGPHTILVQTGDIVDRGRDTIIVRDRLVLQV